MGANGRVCPVPRSAPAVRARRRQKAAPSSDAEAPGLGSHDAGPAPTPNSRRPCPGQRRLRTPAPAHSGWSGSEFAHPLGRTGVGAEHRAGDGEEEQDREDQDGCHERSVVLKISRVHLFILPRMRKLTYMIDVRKLEILRELDRCGTIAATALAVHLTPSAVSQQLATLSREAGTPMLEPDGRRVRLTEAAQLLLSHAHQIFTHLEHAESDLAAFRRGDAGTVRVGTFSSAVKALAVPLISDLATRSRLRVEIREVEPEEAIDALLSRTVDVSMTLASSELLPNENDQRLLHRAPAGRHRGCRAAVRSSAGRTCRDQSGGPCRCRLDPRAARDSLLAAGPGSLRARGFRPAGQALRRRVHRRGRPCRGRSWGEPAAAAGPAGVRQRADRAAPGRRGQPGPPDRRADPGRHRRSAAHRTGARLPAKDRRRGCRRSRANAGPSDRCRIPPPHWPPCDDSRRDDPDRADPRNQCRYGQTGCDGRPARDVDRPGLCRCPDAVEQWQRGFHDDGFVIELWPRPIEQGLRDELKVPARVLVRTRDQVVAAMAADPLGDVATDGSKHFLGFLDTTPTNAVEDIAELADDADTAPDIARLVGEPCVPVVPERHQQGHISRR